MPLEIRPTSGVPYAGDQVASYLVLLVSNSAVLSGKAFSGAKPPICTGHCLPLRGLALMLLVRYPF